MWNNRQAFTGPGGSQRALHHTSSESHTPHSHPFFKCFPASQSQRLTNSLLLYHFSQPPSEMCHRHLCYVVLFSWVPGKLMEQVSVGLFSVGNGIWRFAPKTYEKHLTKRGIGSKNTRHCLWDPPRKLKQSLALFNSIYLANCKRLL